MYRANCDISILIDSKAVLFYVAKYVGKPEKPSDDFFKLMQEVN
jgi:hypothetical protein